MLSCKERRFCKKKFFLFIGFLCVPLFIMQGNVQKKPLQGSNEALDSTLMSVTVETDVRPEFWVGFQSKVNIHVCYPIPVSHQGAGAGHATGTIINEQFGYVVTNRHVIGSTWVEGYVNLHDGREVCPIFLLSLIVEFIVSHTIRY